MIGINACVIEEHFSLNHALSLISGRRGADGVLECNSTTPTCSDYLLITQRTIEGGPSYAFRAFALFSLRTTFACVAFLLHSY